MALSKKAVGLKYGFRSGLEEKIAGQMISAGIDPKFEAYKLPYIVNKQSNYTPDFPVGLDITKTKLSGIVIETKGRFLTADRMKMLMVKEQYPDIEFRFIFSNANARISKVSKTTYAKWCEQNGFKWANKNLPEEWVEEIKEVQK